MRAPLLSICLFLTSITAWSQPLPAYGLFNAKGKKVKHRSMVKALAKADVILFGELHNNPVAHWLQLKHALELHANGSLILGGEMLEADDQVVLDAYLRGDIDRKALDTLARLWVNYGTDYAPLVDFAKQNALPFIATNVPRRYASLVYKKGFGALDTLSEEEKAWIAPLPIDYDPELPGYAAMLEMMGGHGGETLPMAQALKDATMAHFILRNLDEGKVFLHYNGAYHSDRYEGILWYLQKARPELNYVTVSTVTQPDISKLDGEHLGKADFIICVDADFPSSY